MSTYTWYRKLQKPKWAPPSWLFGPVWTVLYIVIAISFGKVFVMLSDHQIGWSVAIPFILNLIFNFAFTPIQFRLKNNELATADILLTLATLIWAMIVVYPHSHWVTYLQIPYLLWVSFASVLQINITLLNRKK